MASLSLSSSEPMAAGLNDEERPHVLVVDDSLVDRKLIQKLFTKFAACKGNTFVVIKQIVENGEDEKIKSECLFLSEELQQQRAVTRLWDCWASEMDSSNTVLQHLKVNVIITDYSMPAMTGYELLKRIKESSYLKEIPVVIVSSENDPARINKCLEGGAKEFMLKPIKQSDIEKLRCLI